MKLQTQLLVAGLMLVVAGIAACGDGDSFGEGKVAAVKLSTNSPVALQMPSTDRRFQAQPQVIFASDGQAELEVKSIEFVSRPDRLKVKGKKLDITCDFDADAGPTFDASGACPANSVCWDFDSICREVGLPTEAFVLGPGETFSVEPMIIPGANGLNCPAAPVGDADVPANYCGELVIKTNGQNTNLPSINEGTVRVFFTHIQGSGQIEVAPGNISFSGINVGTSDSRDIQITNTHADQPLTINQLRMREHEDRFTISAAPSLPAQLGAGDSQTWTLSFTPPDSWDGESFGTNLEIRSTAHNEPVLLVPVQVTSEASRPAIKLSPEVLRFDSEATQTLTVSNEGAANLTLRGFSVVPSSNSAMYTIKEDGNVISGQYTRVIGPGESQDYEIEFSAGEEPGGIGSLEVRYNYFINEQSQNDMAQVELLGDVGDAPIGLVSPDILTFRAATGVNATQSFVIRNVGTEPLVASNVEITDTIPGSAATFSTSAASGLTIAPGAIQFFTVTYQANDDNDDRAALRFGSNSAGEPMVVSLVALAGEASSAEAVITPSFGDGAVAVGAEARFNALLSTGFSQAALGRAQWTLLERPAGSQTFVDKIGEDAMIFPDTAGSYKIALTITDGSVSSQAIYEFSAQ